MRARIRACKKSTSRMNEQVEELAYSEVEEAKGTESDITEVGSIST